ncbi:MAG: type III pantothenate kinase [Elusimicrobia bacterium]|nr:type III pantothenate kinase [Elusimicrobiota bacterium]
MVLGIDIGNSTIAFGFSKGEKVVRTVKLEHEPQSKLFRPKLWNFLESVASCEKIERVVICSVVPSSTKVLARKVRRILGIGAEVVGEDIVVPIVNKYKSPRQVGQDRLLCAFAAREIYGAPVIVIDLGTAITFDAVSKKGEYLGGAIIPGLRLSAEALFQKTELLPRTRIAEPKKVIGRSTEESIQSGLFYGYGALCDGMISRLTSSLPGREKVVMTGGYAEILRKYTIHPVTAVDQDLIFQGMALLC